MFITYANFDGDGVPEWREVIMARDWTRLRTLDLRKSIRVI